MSPASCPLYTLLKKISVIRAVAYSYVYGVWTSDKCLTYLQRLVEKRTLHLGSVFFHLGWGHAYIIYCQWPLYCRHHFMTMKLCCKLSDSASSLISPLITLCLSVTLLSIQTLLAWVPLSYWCILRFSFCGNFCFAKKFFVIVMMFSEKSLPSLECVIIISS